MGHRGVNCIENKLWCFVFNVKNKKGGLILKRRFKEIDIKEIKECTDAIVYAVKGKYEDHIVMATMKMLLSTMQEITGIDVRVMKIAEGGK